MSERISRNWYESTARMVARSSPHGGQPPIKLALVYNHDISMFQLRKGLIEALLARGVDVWLVVPPGPFTPQLAALGAKLVLMPMPRFLSPARDLQLLYRLFRLFRREAFDVAFCITIKPNIWGTLAAWAARVPTRICLVPGAGFVFARGGHGAGTLVRNLTRGLCRIAYALSTKVIFQNHDDHRLFTKGRIAPPSRSVVVRSSGVDLCAFSMARVSAAELFALRAELGLRPETKCVLMVAARMIWSKGVREFVEAAAALASEYPEWRFVLLAPQDPGTPDAVPTSYLEAHKSPNLVVIDRFRPDVLTFHALAEITVLPSFYPEGVPRSLLEAMALAKPIVTCDMPGCRETVVLGYNGYLIPPRDVSALIERLRTLMDDPELRRTLGRHSRALVGREFDERVVVAQTLAHIFGDDGPEAALARRAPARRVT